MIEPIAIVNEREKIRITDQYRIFLAFQNVSSTLIKELAESTLAYSATLRFTPGKVTLTPKPEKSVNDVIEALKLLYLQRDQGEELSTIERHLRKYI